MLIILVFIEQNCTFNLKVKVVCVCEYWSSPHRHPLPYMVCADPETGTVK